MEIRQLVYFIAVAEEKSINKASACLGISQPALSQQIHLLEEEIGVALFNRIATGIKITAAGAALLQHAYAITAKASRAKEVASDPNKWLDVGVCGSSIFTVIPEILAPFIKENQWIKLRLHSNPKNQQIELLRKGEILIAFDRNFPADPDLTCELVLQEEYQYVAMHKDHPFAKRDIIDRTELAGEIFIAANSERALYDHMEFIASRRAKLATQRKIKYRVDDLLAGLGLVGCGEGVAVVSPSTLAFGLKDVVYKPLSGNGNSPSDLLCIYRKDNSSPLLHALLERIREFRTESRQ